MNAKLLVFFGIVFGLMLVQAQDTTLKVGIKPPQDPKKIAIHNGDPFSNWDLDKNSPESIVVFIKDKHGKEVTWGEIVTKENSKNFPAIDFVEFTPPYSVKILTNEYGISSPFQKGEQGVAIAAWHGHNPLKGEKTYNFVCYGKESCEAESKPLLDALQKEWQIDQNRSIQGEILGEQSEAFAYPRED
ncbi:MAG: hypothetical protein WD068_02230 [Candidatus Babeliales bacterium]